MSDGFEAPTLNDVRRARDVIAGRLPLPTPLVYSPGLSQRWDADVSLKLECVLPTGSFKVRGGVYFASTLDEADRERGLATASTGNHAQSIAYGAALAGSEATIFMPSNANPDKVAAVRRLGGRVELVGERFDESRRAAEEFAAERGARFVEPIEPLLVAGVGTAALETLEVQRPDTELVIVPLGGGSGASGWVTVRDGLQHGAEVWAAQSAQAPAAHDAWRSGQLESRPNTTLAEGLATGEPFAYAMQLLQGRLDDFILVDDARILDALRLLWDMQHVMAEPAGVASVAAAEQEQARLRGKTVVVVISGANATREQLVRWLAD